MSLVYIAPFLLLSGVAQQFPSISTPNEKPLDVKSDRNWKLLSDSNRQAEQAPTASRDIKNPSAIDENEIETRESSVSIFRKMTQLANEGDFSSFLDIDLSRFNTAGCAAQEYHPSGVQRKADGKLNGASIIVFCDNFHIVFEIFDLSQDTKITQRITLSSGYRTVSGGYILAGYGKSPSGRIKQSISAMTKTQSITATVSSDYPVSQEIAYQKAYSIISNLMNKPIKPL